MTDHELDLIYRVSQHPLWVWREGMLGLRVSSQTTFMSDLDYERYLKDKNFSGFGPSIVDAYTVYLIWEELKKFNLPGYSIVRSYDGVNYKSGFKKGTNKSVLLYSSNSEGIVALRMWFWCAARSLE